MSKRFAMIVPNTPPLTSFDFAPEACHFPLLDTLPRALGLPNFRQITEGADESDRARLLANWRTAAQAKLRTLVLGTMQHTVPDTNPAVTILFETTQTLSDGTVFQEIRFVFTSEPGSDVPCHLLLPVGVSSPPLAICLQGHTTGMHISLGRALHDGDEAAIAGGDRDFALQAVRRGYAALALEMRAFGERIPLPPHGRRGDDPRCQHPSVTALLLGRTLLGERVWDVSRAIDAVSAAFAGRVSTARVLCMGNSGGGMVSYYAAALDTRITAVMPSCSVCTYKDSIGRIPHCVDNYVPGIGQWFEMADLGVLLAPRPLVVVAGRHDALFPIAAVEEAFADLQEIYTAAGAPDTCCLVVGEEGHRFYAEAAWAALESTISS